MRVLYKLPGQKFWRRLWFVKRVSKVIIDGTPYLKVMRPRAHTFLPLGETVIAFRGHVDDVAAATKETFA
jgi:hypothetical protein